MATLKRVSLCSLTLMLGCSAGHKSTTSASDSAAETAAQQGPPAGSSAADMAQGQPQCGNFAPYKQALFGDLHTHTMMSADAYGLGTRHDPNDAYQYARGLEALSIASGSPNPLPATYIARPLDFDAVTDHSEWLAVSYACESYPYPGGTPLDPSQPFAQCSLFLNDGNAGVNAIAGATQVLAADCSKGDMGPGEENTPACTKVTESAWQYEQAAADSNYVPCTFTTFKGYEWTSEDAAGDTLHKNVVFASDTVPDRPYDSLDYSQPTDLWSALDTGCTGKCTALTIPHNSNLSRGNAFAVPSTSDGVRQIEQYQKLVEIYQHKGASECQQDADGGVVDPSCNFEQLTTNARGPSNAQNYVRTALIDGIASYAARPAAAKSDPLMLGFVAATDDHNGMPGNVKESTFAGHAGTLDDQPANRLENTPDFGSGGLTGVWAQENTRASIFSALQNRETFGTSGPRIQVRFYETWNNTNYCANGGVPEAIVNQGGIPMGGQMPVTAPAGDTATSPWFVVSALQDVNAIAEIDIVKGAIVKGKLVEQIQRISAATNPGFNGSAPCVRWQDTAYDATAPTFYYARVLEVPSPRWTQSSCAEANAAGTSVPGCEAGGNLATATIQERAWTSPIWALP